MVLRMVPCALGGGTIAAARVKPGQHTSVTFHELRTPLGVIIGLAEVLTETDVPVDEATRQEFLKDILTAGRHLKKLIEEMQSESTAAGHET